MQTDALQHRQSQAGATSRTSIVGNRKLANQKTTRVAYPIMPQRRQYIFWSIDYNSMTKLGHWMKDAPRLSMTMPKTSIVAVDSSTTATLNINHEPSKLYSCVFKMNPNREGSLASLNEGLVSDLDDFLNKKRFSYLKNWWFMEFKRTYLQMKVAADDWLALIHCVYGCVCVWRRAGGIQSLDNHHFHNHHQHHHYHRHHKHIRGSRYKFKLHEFCGSDNDSPFEN